VTARGPERRPVEALRAQASGALGRPTGSRGGPSDPAASSASQVGWALLVALLTGGVLGTAFALLSVWAPGLLPGLG
jgi:hypothetical protein